MEQKNYNEEEFLAFLLLYGSHVDIEYSDEEKAKVKSLVNEKTYDRIYNDFINMSDYKSLETILSYKGLYFPTPARKQMLFDKLRELFNSDSEFSVMEKELLIFLERLM